MEIEQFDFVLGEDLQAGTLAFVWTDGYVYSDFSDGYELVGVLESGGTAGQTVQVKTGVFAFDYNPNNVPRKGTAYIDSNGFVTSSMSDKFIGKTICVTDSKAIVLLNC